MKAMIFAAGLGSRLGNITNDKPKALVDICDYKLLKIIINKLQYFGISDIVINVHHFADLIEQFIDNSNFKNVNIQISDERDLLLDTGGGLQKAANLFSGKEPVLVHNVDIISDINFNILESDFLKSGADAMLCVKDRNTSRKLLFNKDLQLCGWKNLNNGDTISVIGKQPQMFEYAFSGISIMKPDFPKKFKLNPPFSLTNALLDMADKSSIIANAKEHQWLDIGKPDTLNQAQTHITSYYKKFIQ